MTSLILYAAD